MDSSRRGSLVPHGWHVAWYVIPFGTVLRACANWKNSSRRSPSPVGSTWAHASSSRDRSYARILYVRPMRVTAVSNCKRTCGPCELLRSRSASGTQCEGTRQGVACQRSCLHITERIELLRYLMIVRDLIRVCKRVACMRFVLDAKVVPELPRNQRAINASVQRGFHLAEKVSKGFAPMR